MNVPTSKKLAVIPAKEEDVQFCVELAKQESHAVGFIPKPRIAEQAGKGHVLVLKRGSVRIGYLHYSINRPRTTIKVVQLAVRADMRRKGYGRKLVEALQRFAPGPTLITLRCAEDLDARHFWKRIGFSQGAAHDSKNLRKRAIVGWARATRGARLLFRP